MHGESRDIAPDEDRLNYVHTPGVSNGHELLSSHDLEEDRVHFNNHHVRLRGLTNGNQHGVQSRVSYNLHSEPVDTTSDAVGSIEQRVFPGLPQRRQAFNAAGYYKSEENRLTTFSDWRYQRVVKKEDLARNGFIYTGTADKVRCVYCNGILRQWDLGDVVEQEHRSSFPDCPFMRGEDVGNIPLQPFTNGHSHTNITSTNPSPGRGSSNQFMQHIGYDIDPIEERCGANPGFTQPAGNGHHVNDAVAGTNNSTGGEISPRRIYSTLPQNPQMSVEPNRLATFKTWPAQIRQRPEELARAGLYYIGADVVVTAERLLKTIMDLEDAVTTRLAVHMDTSEQPQSEDFERLQRENETLRDKQLCKICMERDVEVIFYPCKHFVCCASCSAAVKVCPICRVDIESIDKVFMA